MPRHSKPPEMTTDRERAAWALIREGDWEQQARDYCPTSGNLIDVVLAAMFDLGLTRDDVRNLERLSDPAVVRRVGRHLRFNQRDDVVLYMKTWALILSEAKDPLRPCVGDPSPSAQDLGTQCTFA